MSTEIRKMKMEISGLKKQSKLKNEKIKNIGPSSLEDLDSILRINDEENPFSA